MIETGTIIAGRYRILREIGRGGMSVVYLANDIRLDKLWAIKESRKSDSSALSSVITSSLVTEVNMLKRLRHPALPQVVDIIDNGDSVAIVMDYVEGESLNALVKREGPQRETDVTEWALALCDVLSYLHNQQPRPVIYRDMKPSNVMLRPDGTVAILDLGIAREFKEFNTNDTTVLGTRGYAPPEQYCGQTDARSDIFALGMTMYHLLSGVAPQAFDTSTLLRQHNLNISKEMEAIIRKCIQPAAENRYQSCKELSDDLLKLWKTHKKHHQAKEKSLKRQNKPKKQPTKKETVRNSSRSKLPAIIAVVLMLVLAVGGFFWLRKVNNDRTYESLISVAASTSLRDKIDSYKQAIDIYPYDTRAYMKMLEAYENEGKFAKSENDQFMALYNANAGGFDNTTVEVAELNYKIGMMYFNYYTNNDGFYSFSNRVQKAYPFFAANYENPQISSAFTNKNLSDCYYQICTFYKKHILTSTTAESKANYDSLFSMLKKAQWDVGSAGNYDKLALYNSIFMLLYDQRSSMASVNADEATVLNIIGTVYSNAKSLTVQKDQSQKLQREIIDNYETYRKAIIQAFDNAK